MFDIGFSEMVVIAVVALIVIGPERLPKVAHTLGLLWARAQRYVNGVKADISRDMAIEEMRQLQQKVQAEASGVEQSVKQAVQTLDQQFELANQAVRQPLKTVARQVQLEFETPLTPAATPPAPVAAPPAEPALETKKFPVD